MSSFFEKLKKGMGVEEPFEEEPEKELEEEIEEEPEIPQEMKQGKIKKKKIKEAAIEKEEEDEKENEEEDEEEETEESEKEEEQPEEDEEEDEEEATEELAEEEPEEVEEEEIITKIKEIEPKEKKKIIKPETEKKPKAKSLKIKSEKESSRIEKSIKPDKETDWQNKEDKENWPSFGKTEEGQLAIDMYQTETELIIQSAVAGVRPEDLDISMERDIIVIKGNRKKPFEEQGDYFVQECFWGPFSREIILPAEVDPTKAEAEMKNNILTIKIPKIIREKKRKIVVRG